MLSDKMIQALNRQIEMEGYASFLYLAMSSWCDREGLAGCAQFMRRQSDEERDHMLRIFDYMSEVDAHAITPSISQPPSEYEDVEKVFHEVYHHEQKVTQSIHELLKLAQDERDFTSYNFLQWYIEEQREEEDLMRGILDKLKLIGKGAQRLYFIDKEIEDINASELKKEGETNE